MIRIALVGQPNCGKSTIFNHLVGYKAHTSNLPGTTVEYLASQALIDGRQAEVVDLPGVYSLTSLDEAEVETRNYLLREQIDAVFNIVDASLLSRSLELTLQLLELGLPVVVCLNMEDEARRKGITIDLETLSGQLGAPVVSTIAVRGIGVKRAASEAIRVAREHAVAPPPTYGYDVEQTVRQLAEAIESDPAAKKLTRPRLTAIKLIECDPFFVDAVSRVAPDVFSLSERLSRDLAAKRGRSAESIVSAERHARSMEMFEAAATVGTPTVGIRDRIDAVLMHRVFGIVALGAILYGLFVFVFKVGSLAEAPMLDGFNRAIDLLSQVLAADGWLFYAVRGTLQGVAGAIGIVLPYLLPFLVGLAVLEDIGYLPRAGYLADGLMHGIGLHGKSVIPFILGFGCSVPAIMATRIISSKRDRFITAMLTVMVPCVARTTLIYGLIGYFLGPHLAFLIYVINIVVIAAAGKALTVLFPRVTPGLILEIPSYKVPSLRVVASKVWLRIREFIVYAFPILIAGSLVMGLLEYANWDHYLNLAVSPITWSLGLPLALGIPLIFGVFRKELSLMMLFQAIGTTQVMSVLSAGQMMTFTLFVLFYIPCVATITVLAREFGQARTALVIGTTTMIALAVGLLARGGAALLRGLGW